MIDSLCSKLKFRLKIIKKFLFFQFNQKVFNLVFIYCFDSYVQLCPTFWLFNFLHTYNFFYFAFRRRFRWKKVLLQCLWLRFAIISSVTFSGTFRNILRLLKYLHSLCIIIFVFIKLFSSISSKYTFQKFK